MVLWWHGFPLPWVVCVLVLASGVAPPTAPGVEHMTQV
jgi:hypothetical protein